MEDSYADIIKACYDPNNKGILEKERPFNKHFKRHIKHRGEEVFKTRGVGGLMHG